MDTRPELLAAPQEFYSGEEAVRYTTCEATKLKQYELTRRSLDLAGFLSSPQRPLLLLDVGCGSGLSGRVCDQSHIHYIGTDISTDMLQLARQSHAAAQLASGTPDAAATTMATPKARGPAATSSIAGSSTNNPSLCTGLLLSDMGHGLPFRGCEAQPSSQAIHGGLFDGCLSISAVQWLVFKQDWQASAMRFFNTLFRVLLPGAPAVLQVYVLKESEALKLVQAAAAAGFGTTHALQTSAHRLTAAYSKEFDVGLCQFVVDYPHLNGSKKYSLLLRKPWGRSDSRPAGQIPNSQSSGENHTDATVTGVVDNASIGSREEGCSFCSIPQAEWQVQAAPECPLAWHAGGTCTLCTQTCTQPASASSHSNTACMVLGKGQGHKTQHASEGRKDSSQTSGRQHRDFMLKQHHAHARKLGWMLMRASQLPPAPPYLLSPCTNGDFSLASRSQKQPPATRKRKHGGVKNDASTKSHQASRAGQEAAAASPHDALAGVHPDSSTRAAGSQSSTPPAWQTGSEPHFWWQARAAKHHTAAVTSGVQPLRITGLVDAPHLFRCGGHTSMTVMVTGASLAHSLTSTQKASEQFLARLAGVSAHQVHSVKVEYMPASHSAEATRSACPEAANGQDQPLELDSSGTKKQPRTQQQQQAESDRYIGATLSYHSISCSAENVVGVAALQAPGVHPPYCVLDDCSQWRSEQVHGPAPVLATDCSQPGQQPEAKVASTLQLVAEHCACTTSQLACTSSLHALPSTCGEVSKGTAGCRPAQQSVVAVHVELVEHLGAASHEDASGAAEGDPATAPSADCSVELFCRLIAAAYDTCSTLHIPPALAAVDRSTPTSAVPASCDRQMDVAPALGSGVIKQQLALEAIKHAVCKVR